MKVFRFDPEVGKKIEQFGSVKTIISKVVHPKDEAVIQCVYLRPHGKIGYHQATTQQLFLLMESDGWVRSESDEKYPLRKGQAAFWEKGEWHESSTETGMTAVIIEGIHMEPAKLMPLVQGGGS